MALHVVRSLKRLYGDERGSEGLEKLLIIAAIVLPLLGLLLIFRGAVKDWVTRVWGEVVDSANRDGPDYTGDGVPQVSGT